MGGRAPRCPEPARPLPPPLRLLLLLMLLLLILLLFRADRRIQSDSPAAAASVLARRALAGFGDAPSIFFSTSTALRGPKQAGE